jgi:alpha-tubulin suppressor-like RCC1 family protein
LPDLDLEGDVRGGDSDFPFSAFIDVVADELWTDELFPVLNLDEGVVKVAVGFEASCAVLETGRAICWGRDHDSARLGTNHMGVTPGPDGILTPPSVQVFENVAGGNITDICIGDVSACAVLSTGQVRCWGQGGDGQLGDNSFSDALTGAFVVGITDAVGITCGPYTVCAWTESGALYCWGDDGSFEVPDAGSTDDETPVLASIPEKVVDAALSYQTGCAVTESGKLYCWGESDDSSLFGTIPSGPDQPTPVQVNIAAKVVKVVLASYHGCALTDIGEVYCWGVNSALGLGYHPYDSSMLFIPRKLNQRYFYGKRVVDIAVRTDEWFQYSGPYSAYPDYPAGGTVFLTEDDKLYYTGVKNRLQSEPVPVEYCPSAKMDCNDSKSKGKKGKKQQQLMIVGAAVVGVMMVGLAVRYRRRQRSAGAMAITPTPTI